ncbi:MAG: cupin domain-containing protein [Bacteroidales bacterium]
MILDFNKIEVTKIENFKGGDKEIFTKMYSDESNKIMLSVLKPGASIGYHKHETNCEIIFMIKGSALVTYDTSEQRLKSGQALYCPKGHSHNLINDTEEEIMFFAVVSEIR